ncbi:MAG: hypothetical protein A2V88_12910 [Elusimicrobia bacterium RBG_16_66_12]|nr:MAG: hypothetical protein A2V88_12910 [Elusimicrobia bacterium RBG_16_66_12]
MDDGRKGTEMDDFVAKYQPTDQEIEEAYAYVLVTIGEQGFMADLQATVERIRETRGWDEGDAYAVYRCGVQLYGWLWSGFERFLGRDR